MGHSVGTSVGCLSGRLLDVICHLVPTFDKSSKMGGGGRSLRDGHSVGLAGAVRAYSLRCDYQLGPSFRKRGKKSGIKVGDRAGALRVGHSVGPSGGCLSSRL